MRRVRPAPFPQLKLRHISTSSSPLQSNASDASSFLAQLESSGLLAASDRPILKQLVDQLNAGASDPSTDCIRVFRKLIDSCPVQKSFAVLALFRLALVVKKIASVVLKGETTIIFTMLQRFVDNQAATMAVRLMALCSLANALSHGPISHDLALDRHIVESMCNAIRSTEKTTRMMAATVMWVFCVNFRKKSTCL